MLYIYIYNIYIYIYITCDLSQDAMRLNLKHLFYWSCPFSKVVAVLGGREMYLDMIHNYLLAPLRPRLWAVPLAAPSPDDTGGTEFSH